MSQEWLEALQKVHFLEAMVEISQMLPLNDRDQVCCCPGVAVGHEKPTLTERAGRTPAFFVESKNAIWGESAGVIFQVFFCIPLYFGIRDEHLCFNVLMLQRYSLQPNFP